MSDVAVPSKKQALVNQIKNLEARGGRAQDNVIRGVVRNYWRDYGMREANNLIDDLGLNVQHFDEESPIILERTQRSDDDE